MWVNGSLKGPGQIIQADHRIEGVFLSDNRMEMPAQIVFTHSGYSKFVQNPQQLGLEAAPAVTV